MVWLKFDEKSHLRQRFALPQVAFYINSKPVTFDRKDSFTLTSYAQF